MKKHRIIIAGGRGYNDYDRVKKEFAYLVRQLDVNEIEIVSGSCDVPGVVTFTRFDGTDVYGADGLGERLAKEYAYPVKLFPADWKAHGKPAGPIRNNEMAKYATHCLVFWDGRSKGSKDMIDKAIARGLLGSAISK